MSALGVPWAKEPPPNGRTAVGLLPVADERIRIIDLDVVLGTDGGAAIGYLLSLELGGCDPRAFAERDLLVACVTKLVDRIGMTAHGLPTVTRVGADEPWSDNFGNEAEGLAGLTVCCEEIVRQPITTSNINGRRYRFVNATDVATHEYGAKDVVTLDVNSCRPFDPAQVAGFLLDVLNAKRATGVWHVRRIPT